ncbi:MAG TPA: hypothetical protein VIA07_00825, partial [Desulfuromonadales bacterium]
MMPIRCRWSVVLLMGLLLVGCGLAARPQQDFLPVFKDYVERLRWRDHQEVAAYLPEADREDFLQRFTALDELHIVDVQVESVDFNEEGRRAHTTIALEYYLIPSITVKKARLRQEWQYQGGDRYHPGTWKLAGPFPPFP